MSSDLDGRSRLTTSKGNKRTSLILRRSNHSSTNYDPLSIQTVTDSLKELELDSFVLVDCAHGNSKKSLAAQEEVFFQAIDSLKRGLPISGLLLESFLFSGQQQILQPLSYGVSLTDPCLSWQRTERLVLKNKSPKILHPQFYRAHLMRFILLFLLFASCHQKRLDVLSQPIDRKYLASTIVNTPDWRKNSPDLGQCLIVRWSLPPRLLKEGPIELKLHVIFSSLDTEEKTLSIKTTNGYFYYPIVNDDYQSLGGLLTYRAELLQNNQVLADWRHQMWFDLILLPD